MATLRNGSQYFYFFFHPKEWNIKKEKKNDPFYKINICHLISGAENSAFNVFFLFICFSKYQSFIANVTFTFIIFFVVLFYR